MRGAPPAEQLVDAGLAERLVAARLPTLGVVSVEPLGAGWDCTVHAALTREGRWLALRFPRRAVVLPGFARETALLPLVAHRLPLGVPAAVAVGEPWGPYPWPFSAAPLIAGDELALTGQRDVQRTRVARALGSFLRALHDPRMLDVPAVADLPEDLNHRADLTVRVPLTRAVLAELTSHGLWRPDTAVIDLLAAAERLPPTTGPLRLAHGDLHARQVLVSADRATGIIDWVDVCRADVSLDLAIGFGAFRGAARAEFRRAYGPITAEQELRARAIAVFLAAVLASQAAVDGPPALLADSLASLARAVT